MQGHFWVLESFFKGPPKPIGGPAPWSAKWFVQKRRDLFCTSLLKQPVCIQRNVKVFAYKHLKYMFDSPRSQSPIQGLSVLAMADSVLLIYFEPARPKVKSHFHFLPNETESIKFVRLQKSAEHTNVMILR